MELNPTAYVILGMVSQEPRSGYEIKAAGRRHDSVLLGGQLRADLPGAETTLRGGAGDGVDASGGERKRTVYAITADGEKELKAWLRKPPETSEMREEGLLKLFFAGVLPPEEAVETLRAMRERRLDLAARLRDMEPKALEKDDPFPLVVLGAGIEFNEWFADWCERMERQLLDSGATAADTATERS